MRRPVPWFTVLAVLVLAGCQQGKTTETTPPSPAPAQTSQAPQAQAASPEKEVVTPSGLHYQDLVVGDLEEVRRMALLGLGIAFLPERLAAPEVGAGRLWLLGGDHPGWGVDIFVITDPKAPRQLIRRLFIEEIRRQQEAGASPADKPH